MKKAELKAEIAKHPGLDEAMLMRAYDFAAQAHEGQKRDDGSPYITHPAAVAAILASINMDTQTVAAGLLHDTVEDTPVTLDDIKKEFGEDVAFFVEGVTKLAGIPTISRDEANMETLRKMFMATAQDIRVALIKLADRLHNMRTLSGCAPQKRKKLSQETMDIYAPLAGRLGMGEWKGILEDLAFPHLYPREFEWLTNQVGKAYRERAAYIGKVIPAVRKLLEEEGIHPVDMHGRPKHHWSLYQKLLDNDMDFAKIHDLIAIRVIVETVEDCYKALGVIHKQYAPLPGRIKDYIALPKGSGYQSLHTTVFCEDGRITEFQIRTAQMHREAEVGIAAHWRYKDPDARHEVMAKSRQKRFRWIDQIQEWQKAARGTKEFMDALKLDFLKRHIFVFTPRGDIIDLPAGATAIDFAYAIHSEVGHRCAGAKADGKIITLAEPLQNGMLVEIMTRKEAQPNKDWLRIVRTAEAKKKIAGWFRKRRITPDEQPQDAPTQSEEQPLPKTRRALATGSGVVVAGNDSGRGLLIRIARCCAPLPGDAIDGYVTVHGGIAVHKSGCANLRRVRDDRRRIPVTWQERATTVHPATLRIRGRSRVGLLRDVSESIAKAGHNVLTLTAYDTPDGEASFIVAVEVKDVAEVGTLSAKIRSVKGVTAVDRE